MDNNAHYLSHHPRSGVRIAVADNHNTAPETLLKLAEDEDVDVRFAVADNANRPLHVLEKLAEDSNCYVAARSRKTINRLYRKHLLTLTVNTAGTVSTARRAVR